MKYITFTVLMALSLEATEFYTPSFDCSKVKEKSIEYKICTDAKLSKLDVTLAVAYSDARIIDAGVKASQRAWIKERNRCEDNACIAQAYEERIEQLGNTLTAFKDTLDTNAKAATQVYKNGHDVYKAIELLESAGLRKIVEKRPSFISPTAYAKLMRGAAIYYTETVEDNAHSDNLHYAHDILTSAINATPKDASLRLQLIRAYLQSYYFDRRIWGMKECKSTIDKSFELPYLLKQELLRYVALCKEQGIEPSLTSVEKTILKRDRVYMEVFSTFNGKGRCYFDWLKGDSAKYKKEGFESICSEYVAMLNTLPDDDLTLCSRYVNQEDSPFSYVPAEEAPKEYYKYVRVQTEDVGTVFHHLFEYKGEYFIDTYESLIEASTMQERHAEGRMTGSFFTTPENTCIYTLIDTRLRDQFEDEPPVKRLNTDKCSIEFNYRDKYTIIK